MSEWSFGRGWIYWSLTIVSMLCEMLSLLDFYVFRALSASIFREEGRLGLVGVYYWDVVIVCSSLEKL